MRKSASTSDRTTHRERPPAAFRRFLMLGVDRRSLQTAWGALRGLGERLSWHIRDRAEIEKVPSADPGEHEKATRQQGGFFFRENSSNGGKAIRTFLAS